MSEKTDDLINHFAAALRDKLNEAEAKYGYSDDWLNGGWRDDLIRKLREHVEKGDPRDVAAYCAFAWHHQWSLATPTPPGPNGEAVLERAEAAFNRLIWCANHTMYEHPSESMQEAIENATASLLEMRAALRPAALPGDVERVAVRLEEIASRCLYVDCGSPDHETFKQAAVIVRAALARVPSADGWQPIETAPKIDGQMILGYYRVNGRYAQFDQYSVLTWDGQWWRNDEGLRSTPTHWQALAAAPGDDAKKVTP